MGPCTYLVTGAVTNPEVSVFARVRDTYRRGGIAGFCPRRHRHRGSGRRRTGRAARGSPSSSARGSRRRFHGDKDAKLTKAQEVGAGIAGGTMECWNHPFEAARIEAQTLG